MSRKSANESGEPELDLNEHLPYLMNRAGSLVIQLFSRELAQHDLTVPMWRVLAVLNQHGEQRLIDLAAMTSVEVSTLSRIVSGMHKRNLVDRRVGEASRREVVISMLPAGKKLLDWAIPIAAEYESDIAAGVPDADMEITKRTLRTALEKLQARAVRTAHE